MRTTTFIHGIRNTFSFLEICYNRNIDKLRTEYLGKEVGMQCMYLWI